MMRDHGKPAADFQRVDCEIGDIAGTPDRGLDGPTPGLVGSHSVRGPKYVVKKARRRWRNAAVMSPVNFRQMFPALFQKLFS